MVDYAAPSDRAGEPRGRATAAHRSSFLRNLDWVLAVRGRAALVAVRALGDQRDHGDDVPGDPNYYVVRQVALRAGRGVGWSR